MLTETNNSNKDEPKEFILFKSVSLMDKFNFYEYLSVMLDWWVTIVASLNSVKDRMKNPFFKEKISEIILFITSWDSFSKSMKKNPDIFTLWETSIIEAWEKSGTLVESLSSLALEFKKLHELRQTIKSALTYPIIILIFLVIAVIVVMVFVVPSIIPLLDEAWVEKPFATVALIATSNFISNNFVFLIILFVIIVLAIIAFKKSEWWKAFFDKMFLNMPLVWKVYKNYILASSSSILWVLMNSWVPIIKSLILVWKSSNNVVYEDLFNNISIQVSQWKKIVESIVEVDKTNEFFTSDFLQLLSVWEKTASLDKICKKLNEWYTREVNYSLANLTKWIEPLAILIAWVFVLWFAFAIFGAILKLTSTVW